MTLLVVGVGLRARILGKVFLGVVIDTPELPLTDVTTLEYVVVGTWISLDTAKHGTLCAYTKVDGKPCGDRTTLGGNEEFASTGSRLVPECGNTTAIGVILEVVVGNRVILELALIKLNLSLRSNLDKLAFRGVAIAVAQIGRKHGGHSRHVAACEHNRVARHEKRRNILPLALLVGEVLVGIQGIGLNHEGESSLGRIVLNLYLETTECLEELKAGSIDRCLERSNLHGLCL